MASTKTIKINGIPISAESIVEHDDSMFNLNNAMIAVNPEQYLGSASGGSMVGLCQKLMNNHHGPKCGSVNITGGSETLGWYYYIFIPHRTGAADEEDTTQYCCGLFFGFSTANNVYMIKCTAGNWYSVKLH
jgi:hypothetical protein